MEHFKFKKKLKTLNKIGNLTKLLVEKIHEMPRFNEELRNDIELILYICNIIENEFVQTPTKTIDKKQIVIDILDKIFTLRTEERVQIDKNIDFLHSNGQIKRVNYFEKFLRFGGWCLSVVL